MNDPWRDGEIIDKYSNRPPSRTIKIFKKLLKLSFFLFLFFSICWFVRIYILINEFNLAFESSDNMWASTESNFKGYDFPMVVNSFETYRYGCKKPDVTLFRVTPDFNVPWLQKIISPKKWSVPYREKSDNFKATVNKVSDCERVNLSKEEERLIEKNSAIFIEKLGK